jgi:hypothetical protein
MAYLSGFVAAYLKENPQPWEWEWLANAMLTSVNLLKTVYCRELHEKRAQEEVCHSVSRQSSTQNTTPSSACTVPSHSSEKNRW